MSRFARRIRPYVDEELRDADEARAAGDVAAEFRHLERAHVLGQASTREHVRTHFRMLQWALRNRDLSETLGQLLRIGGGATKTPFGLVPTGNTGGADISPFRRLAVPPDLAQTIAAARRRDGL